MLKVNWFSHIVEHCEVWRVLDLAGMTKSTRESFNFTKANFVYLNGNLMNSLKTTVNIGQAFVLEIRFPNGVTVVRELMIIPHDSTYEKARNNGPRQLLYKP